MIISTIITIKKSKFFKKKKKVKKLKKKKKKSKFYLLQQIVDVLQNLGLQLVSAIFPPVLPWASYSMFLSLFFIGHWDTNAYPHHGVTVKIRNNVPKYSTRY